MSDFNQFLHTLTSDLASNAMVLESLRALLAAFVFGQIIAWAYERTYRGLSYSTGVTHTLILSSMSAALLLLAMKHSLFAGLSLLAALSMIRFRTTLKASKDLVYLMAAITLGVACGANALIPAAIGCLSFTAVSFYLHAGPFRSRARFDGVLRFRTEPAGQDAIEQRLQALLNRHCRRYSLLSVGEVAQGSFIERAYQIKFKLGLAHDELIAALRDQVMATDIRLLLQEATLEY
ncbi:MAG: DUF4956 domain-containing protein [Bradymonadales bacterium]|nr:DUF4956 domain-containing protein [Bradymonadales bacterium]